MPRQDQPAPSLAKRGFSRLLRGAQTFALISWHRVTGPPRVLRYSSRVNISLLRAFGANVGTSGVRVYAPIVLHGTKNGYHNLTIGDHCILTGNNYIDLHDEVTLEDYSGLGPGTTILTHNSFNRNDYLEDNLINLIGKGAVRIARRSIVGAGALILHGVTIGEDCVVAAFSVVSQDVPSRHFVAGSQGTPIPIDGSTSPTSVQNRAT